MDGGDQHQRPVHLIKPGVLETSQSAHHPALGGTAVDRSAQLRSGGLDRGHWRRRIGRRHSRTGQYCAGADNRRRDDVFLHHNNPFVRAELSAMDSIVSPSCSGDVRSGPLDFDCTPEPPLLPTTGRGGDFLPDQVTTSRFVVALRHHHPHSYPVWMRLIWPLTGRLAEMQLIEAALSEEGLSGAVVCGAAGVGKSRIAREALDSAASRGSVTHWAV